MHTPRIVLATPALALLFAACSGGGGGGGKKDPPVEPPPCHELGDVEPNNNCHTPQPFGQLVAGCSYEITGFVSNQNGDLFDGFSFQVPEPLTATISLAWSSPADLDIMIWSYSGCAQLGCGCGGTNPETTKVTTTQAAGGFQLVVSANGGETAYTLTIDCSDKSGAHEGEPSGGTTRVAEDLLVEPLLAPNELAWLYAGEAATSLPEETDRLQGVGRVYVIDPEQSVHEEFELGVVQDGGPIVLQRVPSER